MQTYSFYLQLPVNEMLIAIVHARNSLEARDKLRYYLINNKTKSLSVDGLSKHLDNYIPVEHNISELIEILPEKEVTIFKQSC